MFGAPPGLDAGGHGAYAGVATRFQRYTVLAAARAVHRVAHDIDFDRSFSLRPRTPTASLSAGGRVPWRPTAVGYSPYPFELGQLDLTGSATLKLNAKAYLDIDMYDEVHVEVSNAIGVGTHNLEIASTELSNPEAGIPGPIPLTFVPIPSGLGNLLIGLGLVGVTSVAGRSWRWAGNQGGTGFTILMPAMA